MTEEKRFISKNKENKKVSKTFLVFVAVLSVIGISGIATAVGLNYLASSPGTTNAQIAPTGNSTSASLIKIDEQNILRRTVDDQVINAVSSAGSNIEGEVVSTRSITEFTGNEFITKQYVDSILNTTITGPSAPARESFVAQEVSSVILLSGSLILGPIKTIKSIGDFQNNEFITKDYVDILGRDRVSTTGGQVTNAITTTRQNSEFTNNELVTKTYVDTGFNLINTNLRTTIMTRVNEYVSLVGSTLTGQVLTNQDAFQNNELVDKKYVDDNFNSAIYEDLKLDDTDPVIGAVTRSYSSPGFNPNVCPGNSPNSFTWSGWINSAQAQPLVDATPGLTSPQTATPSTNTNHSVRGFLSYFGVEYNLAKRIEANPERVRIAFSLKDFRTGRDGFFRTGFFDLISLNNTQIATTFSNNGAILNYSVFASYDNVNKTITITSNFFNEDNCAVSVDGIVLSGVVKRALYNGTGANQPTVPVFRNQ